MRRRLPEKAERLPEKISAPPIVIGCFRLVATGMEVDGDPSFADYQGVGDFISRTVKASAWWAADWVAYGESREDWHARMDQLIDADAYTESTLKTYRFVAQNVPPLRRLQNVSFAVHSEVARLPAKEQVRWLGKAETEGWTQRETREAIKASKRVKVVQGQAPLVGQYRVLYADPSWRTLDRSPGDTRLTLSIEALCELPVKAHAAANAILFLWVPASLLLANPGPRDVIEAWGFVPKSNLVWDTVRGPHGPYHAVTHEHLVIATRGSCLPDVVTPLPKSVQTIRRLDDHGSKPEEFRRLIDTHWPHGTRVELFGRVPVEGWAVFGSDATAWATETEQPF